MKISMVSLALALIASPAAAQEWRIVGENQTGAWGIDMESITHSGHTSSVDAVMAFPWPRGDGTDYITARVTYNCWDGARIRADRVTHWDLGRFRRGTTTQDWDDIRSGTLAEDTYFIVCEASEPRGFESHPNPHVLAESYIRSRR